jgi:glycosyltransferase involved in cell wall biosynthesis
MKTRVCVLTSVHPPFDVRIFHKECQSLANAGYEVTLVAPHTKNEQRGAIRLLAVPRHDNRLRRLLRSVPAVYRLALRENADIYHFHDPELIPVGLLLRAQGKTVIYDMHEDLPATFSYKNYLPRWLRWPLSKVAGIVEDLSARWFSALITANPPTADRFSKNHGMVTIVQNFPLMQEFPRVDRSNGDARSSLVYVGLRLTKARGVEEMVRAMGLLDPNVDARLKLIGVFDPPELPAELSRIPGWERVDCLGMLGRSQVSDLLCQARAGLSVLHPEPNYVNAQPVKLYEYMGASIPVIVSDFPVLRRIVEVTRCGLLVDPLDPAAIAAAIEYLWNNPREANEMGERGRLAVETCFNWVHEEEALLGLYNNLGASGTRNEFVSVQMERRA